MTFTELKDYAASRNYDNVHFIFTNSVGTVLHGTWQYENHFSVYESPTPGLINAVQWVELVGDKLQYIAIPEDVKSRY